jgi:hypothetical protein
MVQQMDHTATVALKHYERADEYRSRIASNIFSSSADPEQVKLSLEKAKMTAGFEDPSFLLQEELANTAEATSLHLLLGSHTDSTSFAWPDTVTEIEITKTAVVVE